MQKVTGLWQQLRPLVQAEINRMARGGGATALAGAPAGGVVAHALYGVSHTGTLDPSQAPWVATGIATAVATHVATSDPHTQYVMQAGRGGFAHVDAVLRTRDPSATRYRADLASGAAGSTLNSYDDTLAVYRPLVLDASLLMLRPSGNTALALLVDASGAVTAADDTDTLHKFGRAAVGYVGHGDYAAFAHRNQSNTGGYALLQHRTGNTLINAPAGLGVYHRINNTDAMVMSSSELTMHSLTSWRTNSFVSGFTGNGFRIDNGVLTAGKTTAEFDDLIVRGRMRVYELLVQQIRATNGSIFVSSTGKVKTVSGAGPYSIETDATHGFLVNDLIRAQRFTGNGVYQSNLQVTAVANLTNFTGSLISGDAPAAGMEFVRLGNTSDASRQNSIYMSADDSYNPFIDLIVGVNSFAAWGSTATRKGRIGNLQGLFGVANELGIFVGDGLGVTNKYMRISNLTQESHNIPNKMYDAGGNLFMQMDTSGLNYYVQQAASYMDNTSILFRRPDNIRILRLVGVNNFGSHTGALEVNAGSADSNLQLLAVAPAGYFATTTIQSTVGGSSSQWLFQRLADGTVKADFPGSLIVSNYIGVGVSVPAYRLDAADRIRSRSGSDTAGMWLSNSAGTNRGFVGLYSDSATPITGIWNNGIWALLVDSAGKVGVGTASPEDNLHVAGGGIRVRNSGAVGFAAMKSGDASNIGYLEWWRPNGSRAGYMGYGSTHLQIVLESASDLYVAGGNTRFGNTSDLYGAKIQTSGNIHAQGAVTGELYMQVAAQSTPVSASGFARIFLRSSDNALCAVMPSGNVRVLVTN